MKNLEEMTDEELAVSYIEGDNRAFDMLLQQPAEGFYLYSVCRAQS